MISDTERNVRTLIVSFVIAIMALIPLRFYEAGQVVLSENVPMSAVQVLGAEEENVQVAEPTPVSIGLESPWYEIDGTMVK